MTSSLKNVFEASNARNLSSAQLVNEFIWTSSFSELLYSSKNQIVLGSRGSGKTALIKMLSHENLRVLATKEPKAKKIIDSKALIATYVPLKVEWVNSLNNFKDRENKYFVWSLNLATCVRLLDAVKSCIQEYIADEIDATLIERKISKELCQTWAINDEFNNFRDLRGSLEKVEYYKNMLFNKEAMGVPLSDEEKCLGLAFHGTLFQPFTMATKLVSGHLNFPDSSTWLLCIDEAEFLSKQHHELLNTYMRSASDILFKITTMPFRHHTLSTRVNANINIGHDLEYVYIDKLGTINLNQASSDKTIQDFAEQLFKNRLKQWNLDSSLTLDNFVGKSILSQETTHIISDEGLMDLIRKHCNDKTIMRAQYLYENNRNRYNDEIGRKLRGILVLREEYHTRVGSSNSKLYSGVSIISRCSDGNPRRLFRLFNHLINGAAFETSRIQPEVQSKRIKSFSFSELEVLKFEKNGKSSFELLRTIGSYFKDKTLQDKLGSDLPQAVSITNSLQDSTWEDIKSAVDLGLIYPVLKKDDNGKNLFHAKEGNFSLANCLAPHFNLFPRVGRTTAITTILSNVPRAKDQMELFDYE